jgi:hypothetical protein
MSLQRLGELAAVIIAGAICAAWVGALVMTIRRAFLQWRASTESRAVCDLESFGASQLRPGPCVIRGVVEADLGETPVRVCAFDRPVNFHRQGGGNDVGWQERRREFSSGPFAVALDDGTRVQVFPMERVTLIARFEPLEPVDHERERRAELRAGQECYLRGVLSRDVASDESAYRGTPPRWEMRPPRDGRLVASASALHLDDLRSAGGAAGAAVVVALELPVFGALFVYLWESNITGANPFDPSAFCVCALPLLAVLGVGPALILYTGGSAASANAGNSTAGYEPDAP